MSVNNISFKRIRFQNDHGIRVMVRLKFKTVRRYTVAYLEIDEETTGWFTRRFR